MMRTMTGIDIPVSAPRHRQRATPTFGLMLAIFLGLSSFVVTLEMTRIECQDVYLADDVGRVLLGDDGQWLQPDENKQCRLAGNLWIAVPAWVPAIISR
jgi:hypothetical protein